MCDVHAHLGENVLKEEMLKKSDVNELRSLPKDWREALVPKESAEEGSKLFSIR